MYRPIMIYLPVPVSSVLRGYCSPVDMDFVHQRMIVGHYGRYLVDLQLPAGTTHLEN